MTPNEKAKKLVDDLYQTTPNETWFNPPLGYLTMEYKAWDHAKQCALIAVDEIMNALCDNGSWDSVYWESVKQEIEKL